MPCGFQDLSFPSGIEPRPQQWKPRILATRQPGNSPITHLKKKNKNYETFQMEYRE